METKAEQIPLPHLKPAKEGEEVELPLNERGDDRYANN